MKNAVVLFLTLFILLFSGCQPEQNRTIESVLFKTKEKNMSSYDLFLQYYLVNGKITRKEIYKNIANTNYYLTGGTPYGNLMHENNYMGDPVSDCQIDFIEETRYADNPNGRIQKLLIIDLNTNKIIKRIENAADLYFLDYAEDDYGMRVRWEYWLLEITDEWLTSE
jgi:hypothetical protein